MGMKVQDNSNNAYPEKASAQAVDETAIQNIAKLTKIAGQAKIVNEIAKQMSEKENIIEESGETKEGSDVSNKDTASLTDESIVYSLSEEERNIFLKTWTLEMEAKAWEILLKWFPSAANPVMNEIADLKTIYLNLLNAILSYTSGEEQKGQLAKLEHTLAVALNKLLDTHLDKLTSFVESYGSKETLTAIKASIYQMVTGEKLSPKEIEDAWNVTLQLRANGSKDEKGVLYQPSANGKIHTNRQYSMQVQSDKIYQSKERIVYQTKNQPIPTDKNGQSLSTPDREIIQRNSPQTLANKYPQTSAYKNPEIVGAKGQQSVAYNKQQPQIRNLSMTQSNSRVNGFSSVFESRGTEFYTAKDLQKSQQFIDHIENKGNLFTNPAISARNEEITGALGAFMSVKSQIFEEYSGVSPVLGNKINSAVDKMIDYYIRQYEQGKDTHLGYYKSGRSKDRSFSYKAVYKVYYYILNVFHNTRRPDETFTKGLAYAWKLFQSKKNDSAAAKQPRYEENAGFISSVTVEKKKENEIKVANRVLEKDWKQFLHAINRDSSEQLYLNLMSQSPWGMLVEPEDKDVNELPKNQFTMLVILLVVIAFIMLFIFILL